MQNRIYRELVRKVRQRGLKRLLLSLPQTAFWELKHYCCSRGAIREGRQFDRLFHLETTTWVQAGALDVPNEVLAQVKRYEPTPVSLLRAMLRSLPIQYSDFVFIDFGAGKGRAMIIAAEFHFRKIVGIEISQRLSEVAKQNLAAYRARCVEDPSFEWITGDARDYVFPPCPLIIYLYNPFDGSVLDVVARTLKRAMREHRQEVFVIYYNPVFRSSLESRAAFVVYREARESNYVIYRSVAAAVDPQPALPDVPVERQETKHYNSQTA